MSQRRNANILEKYPYDSMFVDIVTYTQKHVAYKSSTVGRLAIYGLGLVKKVSNESDVGDSGRLLDSSTPPHRSSILRILQDKSTRVSVLYSWNHQEEHSHSYTHPSCCPYIMCMMYVVMCMYSNMHNMHTVSYACVGCLHTTL